MKYRIFNLLCVSIVLFSVMIASADTAVDRKEVETILKQLNDKTIESYETVTIPLKGSPEDFNILPTDDLSTVEFRDGAAVYAVNVNKMNKSMKEGAEKLTDSLKRIELFRFPLYVSNRVVAAVDVAKKGDVYRVISVSSGNISDRFAKALEENKDKPFYYISDGVTEGILTQDTFYNLNAADDSEVVTAADASYILSCYEGIAADGRIGGSGANVSADDAEDNGSAHAPRKYAWILSMAVVFVLFIAFGIYGAHRQKSKQE